MHNGINYNTHVRLIRLYAYKIKNCFNFLLLVDFLKRGGRRANNVYVPFSPHRREKMSGRHFHWTLKNTNNYSLFL